jgi:hypothetical protein
MTVRALPKTYADPVSWFVPTNFQLLEDFILKERHGREGVLADQVWLLEEIEKLEKQPDGEYFGLEALRIQAANDMEAVALYDYWQWRKTCLDDDDLWEKQNELQGSLFELEEMRHQQDEDMLIRLIKIRRSLWT